MPLIQYLSRIQFDFGAIALLSDEIARLGLRRPLLVTDKGVVAAGILERALEAAKPHAPIVYDATTENPSEASLEACLAIWKAERCDGIIALGGGSALDLSKAVALLASHAGRFADYGVKTGGSDKIGRVAPQIAIPTAAGTGAEVGRACVLTLHDGRKTVAVNLNMVADVVICDPDVTLSLPVGLTAATGIDAFSHGVEAFCSTTVNPPAEAIACDCIARVRKWLPVAVAEPDNRDARWHMMMAALQGGMTLQKGLGAAHAMANPLGEGGYHHGTLIGVLLPHVLRFNDEILGEKSHRLAKLLDTTERPGDWTSAFVRDLELPTRLSALGIASESLAQVADMAAVDHLSATNPRKASADDYARLLNAAF